MVHCSMHSRNSDFKQKSENAVLATEPKQLTHSFFPKNFSDSEVHDLPKELRTVFRIIRKIKVTGIGQYKKSKRGSKQTAEN